MMYILVVIFSNAISVCGIWYISPISTSNFYATASLEEGKHDEEAGKKRKGVEKTIILSVIFQYIHFCVSDNYSSKNIGPEQKEKGNTFAFCLLNDSQTLMYMNPSTLE